MAAQGRQEPQRRAERQGASICETRRAQLETASTRGRLKARLFLRKDEWHEKKLTSAKTANDPNSRINKSLRAWNCADGGYVKAADGVAQKGKTKGRMC